MSPAASDMLVTTYLEMTSSDEFKPAFLGAVECTSQGVKILPLAQFDAPFYRFLYREVGQRWHWYLRRELSDAELHACHEAENWRLDVLYIGGAPAGFIELAMHDEAAKTARNVEIAYFGLREEFFGRGLGKHLLSHGVQRAWAEGARRLWLHTCNLDAPQALKNYLRRGFRVERVEEEPMPALYRGA